MSRSILIIKPSSLGDILHGLPALEMLQQQWPDAAIDWVVNDGLADVLTTVPGIRRILRFPRKDWKKFPEFLRELRKESYDIVIDYQGLLRSGLMTWLARGKKKFGFKAAREGAPLFYGKAIATSANAVHAVDKNIELTAAVIEHCGEAVKAAETPEGAKGRQRHDVPAIALCFSSRWESKNWPLDFMADVIEQTARRLPKFSLRLIGAKEDCAKAERLVELLKAKSEVMAGVEISDKTGKTTLPELMELLKHSDAMLTVDSGPMHMAAAVGTPCVALFGATDPAKTGPYGKQHIIIRSKCAQSPCFQRTCPCNGNCAEGISAADTAASLLTLLDGAEVRP